MVQAKKYVFRFPFSQAASTCWKSKEPSNGCYSLFIYPIDSGERKMDELNPIEKYDQDFQVHTKNHSLFKSQMSGLLGALLSIVVALGITYASHFEFGFFKFIFGGVVGYGVKKIGKGSGSLHGVIAGFYAAAAVFVYQGLLSLLFVSTDQIVESSNIWKENHRQYFELTHSVLGFMKLIGEAVFAFVIAYNIGKNPMKKDELDYLLAEKRVDSD